VFFRLVTSIGSGWAFAALILMFLRHRDAILMETANIVSTFIVEIPKHRAFAGSLLPREYSSGTHALHIVPGPDIYSCNRFPSGHAATASASCPVL